MSELYKQSEESFIEYARRLLDGRDNKLYDINSSEIWELLFSEKLSKDEARKRIYGLKATLDKVEDEVVEMTDDIECIDEIDVRYDIIERLEQERKELEKAKIQLRDQKRENASILRVEARMDNVKDFIQQVARDMSEDRPLFSFQQGLEDSDAEGVLLLSDWHYSLNVNNFINTYNTDEFVLRIEKLIDKVIEYGMENKINRLHIVDLGDLISGIIHCSIRVTSSEDVITQTMKVSEVLAEILVALAGYFPQIDYYTVLDNHSRVTPSKDDSLAVESFARFLPWYLEARLADCENIAIHTHNVDEDIIVLEVCGNTCFGTHGHRDKMHDVVQNLSLMLKVFPDYVFLAHNHFLAESETHSIEIVQNGSLSGCDDFAKHIRRSSKPSQKFMIFNGDGRKCTYNIILAKNKR